MITRELKVLILGDVSEVGDIFERSVFTEEMPTSPIHVQEHARFEAELEQEETYNLILIDLTPYGLEVLEQVREYRPACPVIMIGNPAEAEIVLEAKRKGLEAYLLRGADKELFTDLLAEEIYTQLRRYVEPPKMDSPSADEMHRYAQFHNVLEPFFVAASRRYLLYVNKAGQELSKIVNGQAPAVGDPIENWVLCASLQEFKKHLDQAFAGHEVVQSRHFEELEQDGSGGRELHYQPVTDPGGRVVAVSIAVHQPARPELQRARSMQHLTDLAAGVSHEFNNQLNILLSNTSLLADRLIDSGDEEALKRLAKIETAIGRTTRFTSQLQAFSRTSVSKPESLKLDDLIEFLVPRLSANLADEIEIITELNSDLPPIRADRAHWETVVTILVQHGAQQMKDGGKLLIKAGTKHVTSMQISQPIGPGNYIVLEIVYDGGDIADWMHKHAFDPFLATRRGDHYAGLGLATVKSIVEQGGGHISADSKDKATTIRIYYPTVDQALNEQDYDGNSAEKDSTILLVEDEAHLREAFAEILTIHGYHVITAAGAVEAKNIYDNRDTPVDLLITDVVLEQESGIDLVKELIEQWPQLKVIFISGHAPEHLPQLKEIDSKQLFLRKPVPIPVLLEAVEEFSYGDRE